MFLLGLLSLWQGSGPLLRLVWSGYPTLLTGFPLKGRCPVLPEPIAKV